MLVKSCDLYQFRNFDQVKIEPVSGLNFFIGKNGHGKSNLLEALHTLSSGRSFRSAKPADMVSYNHIQGHHTQGDSAGSCACIVENSLTSNSLRVVIRQGRQEYYVNEQKVRGLANFIGHFPSICFTPDDLDIIKGSPDGRRKLFDKNIVTLYPETLAVFVNYSKALKSKNHILKTRSGSPNEITAWNQILAQNALKIYTLRQQLLDLISPILNYVHKDFTADTSKIALNLSTPVPADIDQILNRYQSLANIERERGQTLFGPHRDDIEVLINQKQARSFASQGQARSLVLAIKLAAIELFEKIHMEAPVVLLDDVDSELDMDRSAGFFDLLFKQKRQVFISGTDFSDQIISHDQSAKVFRIEAGKILS